jgi:glyoxylase-like metal-dependent hydrolase (beta-lactamase superfamily II)
MNRIFKRILLTIVIIIGVSVLAGGGMYLKLKSEMSGFAPLETGKVMDDIYAVKDDFANVFIIKDTSLEASGDIPADALQDRAQYIVIDCATNKAAVAEQMKKLGIAPDEVAAVFLTHTDFDHVGALSLFEKSRLYMAKEEEQMINGKKNKFLWFSNSIARSDYTLIEDREVVRIGSLTIEGILVPGHTSGTMAYLVNDKYLFTGDILSLKDGRMAPIPAFFNMDDAQATESIDIIRHIPAAQYIFTAHWGYTDDYKAATASP